MAAEELYFKDSKQFFSFMSELEKHYPTHCTDRLGNTCPVVEGKALDLAECVDLNELTENEAKVRAQQQGESLARECKYGLSQSRKCGRGLLCYLGNRE